MQVIYEPTGKAKEYADLACNLYNGCTHGCQYCYAKRYKKEEYYTAANPKKDVIEKLKKDVDQLNGNTPEILLSFQGDVYQHAEMELQLTRQSLEILREKNLPFTILTKGGTRAVRDFDILEGYQARFGTSLVWLEQVDASKYEPGAALIGDRIEAIEQAKKRCIPTWISLEPVIDTEQALELVFTLHSIVDFWKIGKINHNKELESQSDWLKFREDITEMLDRFQCQYYIKKSLAEL